MTCNETSDVENTIVVKTIKQMTPPRGLYITNETNNYKHNTNKQTVVADSWFSNDVWCTLKWRTKHEALLSCSPWTKILQIRVVSKMKKILWEEIETWHYKDAARYGARDEQDVGRRPDAPSWRRRLAGKNIVCDRKNFFCRESSKKEKRREREREKERE